MSKCDFFSLQKIFIVSAGRTGTEFFGKNMAKLSDSFYSIHEPDRLSLKSDKIIENVQKIKKIGFTNAVIKKILGTHGSRNLSLNKISGKLAQDTILKRLIEDRKWIPSKITLYIESNYQLFGVINELLNMENSKVIIFFRDPRHWVTSWMNRGSWYDKKDLLYITNLLGLKRLTPKNIGENLPGWKNYTRFEKLCWAWSLMNSKFYHTCKTGYPNLDWYFFEDIFIKNDKQQIKKLLLFILDKNYKQSLYYNFLEFLKIKVNTNPENSFPDWHKWSSELCIKLENICGDLMLELGYGEEHYWNKKLN